MNAPPVRTKLHQVAHSRTGDKGDRLNASVLVYRPELFDVVREQVTAERVREILAARAPDSVTRYELPNLHALNFVIDGVLDGGVNASLNLDGHGKSLSFRILEMEIQVPAHLAASKA